MAQPMAYFRPQAYGPRGLRRATLVLAYYGINTTEDTLAQQLGTTEYGRLLRLSISKRTVALGPSSLEILQASLLAGNPVIWAPVGRLSETVANLPQSAFSGLEDIPGATRNSSRCLQIHQKSYSARYGSR